MSFNESQETQEMKTITRDILIKNSENAQEKNSLKYKLFNYDILPTLVKASGEGYREETILNFTKRNSTLNPRGNDDVTNLYSSNGSYDSKKEVYSVLKECNNLKLQFKEYQKHISNLHNLHVTYDEAVANDNTIYWCRVKATW
jgi:hypothetical protein